MFVTGYSCTACVKIAEHSSEVEQARPRPVTVKMDSLVTNLG